MVRLPVYRLFCMDIGSMKLATFILYRAKSRSLFVESQMMSNSCRFVE